MIVMPELFLAYCLFIRPIFNKWQGKDRFAPIDSNAEKGPALRIAICREKADAMCEWTGISRPRHPHPPYIRDVTNADVSKRSESEKHYS